MAGTIIGMCKKPRSVHLGFLWRRRIRLGEFRWWAMLAAPVLAAALVLIATRHDPLLSPDSITYLSAADHVRAGHGLTDFTGKSLAVFGPIFPLLLAPGGRSLVWATVVGATSIAAGGALMAVLLQRRVRPITALAGALALGASQGLVRMASVVWSEAPYAAIALAMLVVLSRWPITTRTAAIGGLLAGVGFLTRYAGVGLMATGAVMVAASAWRAADRDALMKRLGAFAAGALGYQRGVGDSQPHRKWSSIGPAIRRRRGRAVVADDPFRFDRHGSDRRRR